MKKTTSPLKETDPLALFVQQANLISRRYFKFFLAVVLSLLAAYGVFLLYSHKVRQDNRKAEGELYQARKTLREVEKKQGGDFFGKPRENLFFLQRKKALFNGNLKQAFESYLQVTEKHISTSSGVWAALELGFFLSQYEDHREQALALLQRAWSHAPRTSLKALVAFSVGVRLMEFARFKEALVYFKSITQEENWKWLWPQAFVKQALCYEKQNRPEEAEKLYLQIQKDFPDSSEKDLAGQYLNGLKLKALLKKQSVGEGKTPLPNKREVNK